MDRDQICRRADHTRGARLDGMPSLPLPAALLLSLYICLCMVYVTVWQSESFGATILFLSAIMAALTLRSPWLIGMLTVPSVMLIAMTGSLTVAAVPIALLCGAAYGSFLILNVRSLSVGMIPIVAFSIGMLLTADAGKAILALLCIPAALTLAYVLHKGMPRMRAICYVAVVLALTLLVLTVASAVMAHGASIFGDLSGMVTEERKALADRLASWETGVGDGAGRVVLEGMEFALAATLFNILPGAILALLAIAAYLIHLICLTLFRTYERAKYLSRRVFVLAVSLPAATVFLVGCLMLVLIDDNVSAKAQFAEVVAENLYLALLPAMILVGMLCCIRIFLRSRHRLLLLCIAILLPLISFSAALSVLSVLGAGNVVWRAIRGRLRMPRNPE